MSLGTIRCGWKGSALLERTRSRSVACTMARASTRRILIGLVWLRSRATVLPFNFVYELSMVRSNVVKYLRQMVLAYRPLSYKGDLNSVAAADMFLSTPAAYGTSILAFVSQRRLKYYLNGQHVLKTPVAYSTSALAVEIQRRLR